MRDEPDNHQPLGDYLRAARERTGWSIRDLAKRAGIHFSYLARLENGDTAHPSPELLQRLAELLEVDAAELLSYIGVKPELPEPRMYFRRVYGVDAVEADILARLIEDRLGKDSNERGES